MRLTPLVEKWGLNLASVQRQILLNPECSKWVKVEKRGRIHTYTVLDPEGLKNFLKSKGFSIKEDGDA
ncbi:hypothetical protein [Desulfurobacterium sp.]